MSVHALEDLERGLASAEFARDCANDSCDRARTALRRFGSHEVSCMATKEIGRIGSRSGLRWSPRDAAVCTCGLSAAMTFSPSDNSEIVRRWNAHDDLLAFSQRALAGLEALERSRSEPATEQQWAAVAELRALIGGGRAAITKAGAGLDPKAVAQHWSSRAVKP